MKILIPTILGILGLAAPMVVQASQTVQGTIASNTVWEASQGPYIIQGKVVVERGATLTLLPGTKVYFASSPNDKVNGSSLIVRGGLVAAGTKAQPIHFGPQVTGEIWGQLYYEQSDPDHSVLKNCVITGGRVVCNASSPTIEQCSISGSRNALVVGPDSRPRIIGNRIVDNTIGLTFLDGMEGSVVSGNAIFNNDYGVCAAQVMETSMAENHIFGNRLSDRLDPLSQRLVIALHQTNNSRTLQMASRGN